MDEDEAPALFESAAAADGAYRVIARKYRPSRLSELIGQDMLVRTLTNALTSGRIAHSFLLCGIRGVGKTTTARIIARALNCTGPDGKGGPTPEPCGVCPSCRSIGSDSALDVIEMDAATRTGIDDVREIVDAVRYAPTASRYKVYIIDEVHMLSEKAFNGLLKTLEEPPPHAKFVFATTEVRKIPITVLSRCQRFDLKRVEPARIEQHLGWICGQEGVEAEPDALALIAAAAEGSVRDSLSLLDQAMALARGPIEGATVQEMLGLGDRSRLIEIAERLLAGDAPGAVATFFDLYAAGAEPATVMDDLLEIAHRASRLKIGAGAGTIGRPFSVDLEARLDALAAGSSVPVLARLWQMLLKGKEDIEKAPNAVSAAEMVLMRVACAADLPPPGDLARLLRARTPDAPPARGEDGVRPLNVPEPVRSRLDTANPTLNIRLPGPPRGVAPRAVPQASEPPAPARPLATVRAGDAAMPAAETVPATSSEASGQREKPRSDRAFGTSFADLVDHLAENGFRPLATWLEQGAHLIRYEPGRSIEFRAGAAMPGDIANQLNDALAALSGQRWGVALGHEEGQPTLAQQRQVQRQARLDELRQEPAVRRLLDTYPGATLVDVRPVKSRAAAAEATIVMKEARDA